MARRRDNRILERALLETQLQLGPQGAGLRGLLTDLAGSYDRTRKVNASNERAIVGATRQARPAMERNFDDALATAGAQQRALGAVDTEQSRAFGRRIGEQKSNALGDLLQRETRATEGRVYANEQARGKYFEDKAKIQNQLASLAQQSGLLTATRYGDLRDEQLGRGIERGKMRETQRANRVAEQLGRDKLGLERDKENRIATEGPKKPKGVKWASQEQHANAKDAIERAQSIIASQKRLGRGRAATIKLLIEGRPASKVTNSKGEEVTLPKIEPVGGDLARAAANLAWDGTLSRGDVKRLHGRRLQIKRLGYPTRKKGQGAPKRQPPWIQQILPAR